MKSMRCFSFCPFWKVSAATRPDSSQAPRHHLHSFLGPGLLVQKNSQNQLLPEQHLVDQIRKSTSIPQFQCEVTLVLLQFIGLKRSEVPALTVRHSLELQRQNLQLWSRRQPCNNQNDRNTCLTVCTLHSLKLTDDDG